MIRHVLSTGNCNLCERRLDSTALNASCDNCNKVFHRVCLERWERVHLGCPECSDMDPLRAGGTLFSSINLREDRGASWISSGILTSMGLTSVGGSVMALTSVKAALVVGTVFSGGVGAVALAFVAGTAAAELSRRW